MKTFMANDRIVEKKWYVIDATGKTLGRLSTEVASLLQGKGKPIFTPHVDCGDYVIVINAEKIELTGNKWEDKKYYRHTGYQGGIKVTNAKDLMKKFPTRMIEKAVFGMLPKNKLGDKMAKKLYVYAGPEHPHTAQKPETLEIK